LTFSALILKLDALIALCLVTLWAKQSAVKKKKKNARYFTRTEQYLAVMGQLL